jgi:hypothetical protein
VKITLDLDRLREEGRITGEEYARLESLAARETASLALNVLVAFGVVAVAGGTLALLRSAEAAIVLGCIVAALGLVVGSTRSEDWQPLAVILLMVGSLMGGGGVVTLTEGSPLGFAFLSVAFAGVAILARSGLLAALSALALLAASGGATGYSHALYWLNIEHPLFTILVFGLLSVLAHRISLVVSAEHARLATIFARTCLLIVNLGFWIGSLWGDRLWAAPLGAELDSGALVPDWAFALAWAIALGAAGVWAARSNRRWVVNLVAVFGSIHFYTQYFERLGATPGSVVIAGVIALVIAVVLIRYNRAA